MARIQDRKRNFYGHKQSVREESLAPLHLESAGDILVKTLAKKQLETSTSLEEQLKLTQNFEKGFELNPCQHQGISSLEELKKEITNEEEKGRKFTRKSLTSRDYGIAEETPGLSRHELELSLCEKPNSEISKLYKFALRNKKQKTRTECLEYQLPDHPINHLTEIEEKYFGHLKTSKLKDTRNDCSTAKNIESKNKIVQKKRKHRKRRKKCNNSSDTNISISSTHKLFKPEVELSDNPETEKGENIEENSSNRPSLWDVKDMKKWCEPKKEYSCKPQTFYTIKEGKIIKLE